MRSKHRVQSILQEYVKVNCALAVVVVESPRFSFLLTDIRLKEVHIMRPIDTTSSDSTPSSFFQLPDFYSTPMNLLILGFIRPEYDYVSKEALIDDIKTDCAVAVRSLQRPAYQKYFKQAIETAGFSSEIESQSDSQSKERL